MVLALDLALLREILSLSCCKAVISIKQPNDMYEIDSLFKWLLDEKNYF